MRLCPDCRQITRRGPVCGHCSAPQTHHRSRADLSAAAVTLGLVTVLGSGCTEVLPESITSWFTEEEDQRDLAVIYGSPDMMDAGPPDPILEDMDRDGYPPPEDCDDSNPEIHPLAADESGDGVDSDCDGEDGPESAEAPE